MKLSIAGREINKWKLMFLYIFCQNLDFQSADQTMICEACIKKRDKQISDIYVGRV